MRYFPLFIFLCACAPLHPVTPAQRVASSGAIRHKFESDGCYPYVLAVQPALRKAGATKVHPIKFQWANAHGIGIHNIVAYTDSSGDWVTDNMQGFSNYETGKSDSEKVAAFMLWRFGMEDSTTTQIIQ